MGSAKSKIQKLKAKDYGFQPWQKLPGVLDKHFSKYHDSMFDTKAWQELTPFARTVYFEMVRKFTGRNHENIMYKYEEGCKLMSPKRFTSSIDELINHGFIRIAEHNPHNSKCNIYAFHTAWHQYGTSAFKVTKREKRK